MRYFLSTLFLKIYRLNSKVNKLFLILAAGFLSKKHRQEIQSEQWKKLAMDYVAPKIMLRGLHDWEEKIIAEHVLPTGKVLVVGSGGGREILALCEKGYQVEGIDVDQKVVGKSNSYFEEHHISAKVQHASCEEFSFQSGPYDLVYFSWYVYCYVFPKKSRHDLLKRVAANLSPEGCCMMVLLSSSDKGGGLVLSLAQWVSKITCGEAALEKGDWFDSDLAVEHIFTETEMAEEAEAAGLRLVKWEMGDQIVAALKLKS